MEFRNTILNVGIKTKAQLPGGVGERLESVPGMHTEGGTRTEADIPFPDPLSNGQFRGVFVQGEFRVFDDLQQGLFWGQGFGNALVQVVVVRVGGEARFTCAFASRVSQTGLEL